MNMISINIINITNIINLITIVINKDPIILNKRFSRTWVTTIRNQAIVIFYAATEQLEWKFLNKNFEKIQLLLLYWFTTNDHTEMPKIRPLLTKIYSRIGWFYSQCPNTKVTASKIAKVKLWLKNIRHTSFGV